MLGLHQQMLELRRAPEAATTRHVEVLRRSNVGEEGQVEGLKGQLRSPLDLKHGSSLGRRVGCRVAYV